MREKSEIIFGGNRISRGKLGRLEIHPAAVGSIIFGYQRETGVEKSSTGKHHDRIAFISFK